MARAITEQRLYEVATKAIPKGLPRDIIADVEIDTFSNSDRLDGISYWVYLVSGYRTEGGAGCHTIHEDNLKEVSDMMWSVVRVEDDDDGFLRNPKWN